jgi:PPM family protein phosphatase
MITSLSITALTNTGLSRRWNEDSMLIGKEVSAGVSMNSPVTVEFYDLPVLLSVADGIGGSVAGDLASHTVMWRFSEGNVPLNEDELKIRVLLAKKDLESLVLVNPILNGLGTTIAGVLCCTDDLIVFSCGDSRVYLVKPGQELPDLVTRDHSVIQEMIESGSLDKEEARSHPLGHVITSCISGGTSAGHPDLRVHHRKPVDGDRLIICTDGVWDYGGIDFLKAVTDKNQLSEVIMQVYQICMNVGAPDNFTIIIADIKK